jgi:hypothetical protein
MTFYNKNQNWIKFEEKKQLKEIWKEEAVKRNLKRRESLNQFWESGSINSLSLETLFHVVFERGFVVSH